MGAIVKKSTGDILECITAGISGAVDEPVTPDLGNNVSDGTVMWTRAFAVASTANTSTTTTITVEGGTVGVEYAITNYIVSSGGHKDDETLVFKIIDK